MRVVLWVWAAGCTPGSGYDDQPPTEPTPDGDADADADTDSDADADADADSDTDADTDPTGATAETGGTTGDTGIPPLGEGLINEVLASPPTGDAGDANCDGVRSATDDEFVELVNVGAVDLELSGGRIEVDGALRHLFPAGTVLAPGEAIVVFAGGSPVFDGSGAGAWCAPLPPAVWIDTASVGPLQLVNTGGAVRVEDGYGRLVADVTYGNANSQSANRKPELTASVMVPHTTVPGALGPFSPGTLADGLPIALGPDDTADTGVDPLPEATTIAAVQQGTWAVGTEVALSGVVSATASDGVFVQDGAGAYSGVWVYTGGAYGPFARGDLLDVVGQLQEPGGETTIDLAASVIPSVTVTGSGPEPAASAVTAAALDADPEPWEGVLVELTDVVVPTVGGGNTFTVTDLGGAAAVTVDDRLALYSGYAGLQVGQRFDTARGVFAADLLPRDDLDLVATAPLPLVIDEVLGDPPATIGDANCDGVVGAADDDFVEILNVGAQPVELAGLTLSDSAQVRHTFAAGALAPGERVVVFGGGSPVFDGTSVAGTWCAPFAGWSTTASEGALGVTNTGDTFTLASGLVPVDVVTFGAEIASDGSLTRDPPGTGALVAHATAGGAVWAFSPGTDPAGAVAPYRATVTIDGDPSDWGADGAVTSTAGTAAHVAWDGANLTVGLQHASVAETPNRWFVVYLGKGDGTGTTTGLTSGVQQPTLPFAANHAIRWNTDGSANGLATWNGAAWIEVANWLGTNGSAVAEDDAAAVVELSIPYLTLGYGPTIELVTAVVDLPNGITAAGVPSTTFVDASADPDYATGYQYHPNLAPAPNSYLPVP